MPSRELFASLAVEMHGVQGRDFDGGLMKNLESYVSRAKMSSLGTNIEVNSKLQDDFLTANSLYLQTGK